MVNKSQLELKILCKHEKYLHFLHVEAFKTLVTYYIQYIMQYYST